MIPPIEVAVGITLVFGVLGFFLREARALLCVVRDMRQDDREWELKRRDAGRSAIGYRKP